MLDTESARFIDDEGRFLSESISQNSKKTVEFTRSEMANVIRNADGNSKKVTLSHNHPTSTGISALDLKMLFQTQLGGVRAVTREGHNFVTKKIGNMSYSEFRKVTNKIAKNVNKKFPDLVKIARQNSKSTESKKLAQFLVDDLMEELINLRQIEYIKYE